MAPIATHEFVNGVGNGNGNGESVKPSKGKVSTKEVMELEHEYSA